MQEADRQDPGNAVPWIMLAKALVSAKLLNGAKEAIFRASKMRAEEEDRLEMAQVYILLYMKNEANQIMNIFRDSDTRHCDA
jgi:cytochrome c-type biogenesis protein CcmH/NrfG